MLDIRVLAELFVAEHPGGQPRPLSAASGLVQADGRLYVVADDENHLGRFDPAAVAPGSLVRLLDGELPLPHAARKAAKPDFEALLRLPPLAGHPCGALMALGSGSRPSRQRAALLALDGRGGLSPPAATVDLSPLYGPLHDRIADLNLEGGFVDGERFCLLQRGNGAAGVDALVEWRWDEVRAWLSSAQTAPRPRAITRHALGDIDGVPLAFTDAAPLPGGRWLFSAAAEDTRDTYADGRCAGSAVGVVAADGAIVGMERLALGVKVEGVEARPAGDGIELLMVTDGDDRSRPAMLLGASLRWASLAS